jgi:RDD family
VSDDETQQPDAPRPVAARRLVWSDRLMALAIDAFVLLLLGLVVGFAAGRYLPPVGWTKLVGWGLGTTYLGVSGSRRCGGQTAGLAFCHGVLVDSESRLLSLPRSLIRAAVLVAPWCLSAFYIGAQLPSGPVLGWLSRLVTFGTLPVSLLIFLVGFRRGQFFHDILVGSFIVVAEDRGRPVPRRLGPLAIALPALWIAAVGAWFLPSFFREAVEESTDLARRIRALDGVAGAQVVGRREPDGTTHGMLLLGLEADAPPCTEVFLGAAKAIHDSAAAFQVDRVTISCVSGWNDGLVHWIELRTRSGPPDAFPR